MTVAYRGSITARPSGSTATVVLTQNIPSLANGDLMLMAILASHSPSTPPIAPAGWNLVDKEDSGNNYLHVYSKIANSEPATYTLNQNTGIKVYGGGIIAFYSTTGATLGVHAHANLANPSSTDRFGPSVTTTKASAGLAIFMNISNTTANTPDPSMNEQWDENFSGTFRNYLLTQILASAGATGIKTVTGAAAVSRAVTVAVAEVIPPDGAPSGLSGTPASQTQINLIWVDNSTNETGFELERSADGSTGWAQIATPAANATSANDTGLTANTTYYYRIRAVNADGSTSYSDVASATTLPNAPSAPSGLSGSPASQTQINLTWVDNSSNETGFELERSPDGVGSWAQVATPAANATSQPNSGLTANTTYYYRIRAVNSGGNSAYSSVASATTLPNAPTAPSNLVATGISATEIDLTWDDNASNETGFKVERSPNGSTGWVEIATPAANTELYHDTGLTENTQYYYRVRASNTGGNSSYTSVANAFTLASLAPPEVYEAEAQSPRKILITWEDNNSEESGYLIERSPNGTTGWVQIADVPPGSTQYLDTGLMPDNTYYYRVRAYIND